MKTEDFERLKAVCEKEGFTIESYSGGKTAIIGVKDIWDGVEFVNLSNIIFKVLSIDKTIVNFIPSGWTTIRDCKPSTESAYVEQLKKEAFERFGEIKEGDRFDFHGIPYSNQAQNKATELKSHLWHYSKWEDTLYAGKKAQGGGILYRQGKWATKVKERVRVDLKRGEMTSNTMKSDFIITGTHSKPVYETHKFLAKQLEKYLNDEV